MSDQTTIERLAKIICDQLGSEEEQIKPEARLDDLGADSLDAVELMMAVEEEWEIEITDQEAEKVQTVANLVELIDEKLA